MNNILKCTYYKTSSKIKVNKLNNHLIVENRSSKREQLVFLKPIFTKNKIFKFDSKIKTIFGEDCNIKIFNRKRIVLESVCQNTLIFTNNLSRMVFIGISLESNSKYEIGKLEYELNVTENDDILKHCKSKILLLTTGYPSNDNKYNTSFVHTRVLEYKKQNIDVDVVVSNELFINKTEFYNFEGVNICRTGYNQIRQLLLKRKYDKILVHFIRPAFLRLLDANDISNTQIFLYTHGVDTLYNAYERIGIPYNNPKYVVPDFIKNTFSERDEIIKRFNNRPNVKFIFGSNWNLNYAEKLLNIKFNNYAVIPSFIDEKLYNYIDKDEDLRKKIFIIRPQNNLNSYSVDIDVRVILELSRRECFKDLEFSIYGTGTEHDWLVAPLKQFKNVHIYNKFLTHDEIAKMHKKNGIGIFASRFDTMAVSACEAAMSGCVVVTSKNIGTTEYIQPEIGTYCDTENYIQYADIIENLYNNPKLFRDISKKMHNSVYSSCSYKYSIKKDIDSFVQFNEKENLIIPDLSKNPLLSISIAGYNISDYVVQLVSSIVRSKYSKDIEVLVINDGSKDDTVDKISNFVKQHYHGNGRSSVIVVDKENGGHGSTLNKGLELATGKYFKLLDGDDYYITEELDKLIEILKTNTSDLVLTDFVTDNAIYGDAIISNNCPGLIPGVEYNLDDASFPGYGFGGDISWGPQLHTATYKTDLLKSTNFKIDEHCFYVDMEYNINGLLAAQTVTYYPLHVYSYYIGRDGQSVSVASYKKNVYMHEKVCLRLIEEYEKRANTPGKKINIYNNMIVPLCRMQYDIVTLYLKSRNAFKSFDDKLKQYPTFYNDNSIAGRRVKIYRKTNGLLISLDPLLRKFVQKIKK